MWKLPEVVGSNSAAAATKAMTELGVAACIGAGCVENELLTRPMVTSLSKTTFSILLPMFLGTSILKTISKYGWNKSSLAGPLMGILQPFLLYHITKIVLLPLMGIDCDSDDGRCTAVCSAWGNTSVVPLIFVNSLFRGNEEYLAKSYANISLFLVGWSPFFWSYGRSALFGTTTSSSGSTCSEDLSYQPSIPVQQLMANIQKLFSPPVTGVAVGMIIAIFPAIRNLFVGTKNAPLQTIFNTFETFGKAASPLSLLVLTSSLALGIGIGSNKSSNNMIGVKVVKGVDNLSEETSSSSFFRQWMCVSIARFIISPILVMGLLHSFHWFGLIADAQSDPILWFISVLQGCMPSAQNLVLMLQVANKQQKAGAIAKFLFFVYATSMIPVVFIVSAALLKFGLA